MRALWLTERFPPDRGGAAVSARRQTESLAASLDRIDVVRLSRGLAPGDVVEERRGGVYLHTVGAAPEQDESLQILSQTAINLQRTYGHDLLHGFYAVHAGYVAGAVARQLGLPSVVSLRGNDLDRAMFHGPRLPFLLWTLEHAGALLGVSNEILRKATALTGRTEGLHRVPNGVDISRFVPPNGAAADFEGAPRPWIGFSGELRLKKGLPVLLRLAELLDEANRGTLFLIGGVRSEMKGMMSRWKDRTGGAARRIRELAYTTETERLSRIYGAMDLLVFPSLWDGLPNSLLEAMACARPVLATAIGGTPEIVESGRNGILVGPHELDQFPRKAIELCAADPSRLAGLGSEARARVEAEFTPEREREAILAVYRGLLG